MHLLAVDFGTYCDFKIMQQVIRSFLAAGHTVFYLTDAANRDWALAHGVVPLPYQLPPWLRKNLGALANTASDYTLSTLKRLVRWETVGMYAFLRTVTGLMKHVCAVHTFDAILFHYPALLLHMAVPRRVLETTPVAVMYVAPALPNETVPWLFTSTVRTQALYERGHEREIADSHHRILRDLSPFRGKHWGLSSDFLEEALHTKFHILASWDPKALPTIRSPGFPYLTTGAIVDRELVRRAQRELRRPVRTPFHEPAPALRAFLAGPKKRLVYFSTGSFPIDATTALLALRRLSGEFGLRVLYHDVSRTASDAVRALECPDFHVLSRSIPHEWIVPRCALVVTTGSVCLANICYLCRVPMLFVPILNEQHFWAKNYEHFTGVAPVDVLAVAQAHPQPDDQLAELLAVLRAGVRASFESRRVAAYLGRVQASIEKRDGAALVARAVEALVAKGR